MADRRDPATPCHTCTHAFEDHDDAGLVEGCRACPFWECAGFVDPPKYDAAADHDPIPGLRVRVAGTAASGGADV